MIAKIHNSSEITTLKQMMQQRGVSARTTNREVREGKLPPFTYGGKGSHHQGWHKSVLEAHALQRYSSQVQNVCGIGKVGGNEVPVNSESGINPGMSEHLTNPLKGNGRLGGQQRVSKEMPQHMRSASSHADMAAAFADTIKNGFPV